jgi:AAA domain, putative AbiEii toxin, Type IV TA system/AAA ATPase domain
MGGLILDSLEICNYRAFRHLVIEQLGRVNLIVGRNSVGKTSLLEALWLYARRGVPAVVWEQLTVRSESAGRAAPSIAAVSNIFYGRPNALVDGAQLSIGPSLLSEDRLQIAIEQHDDTSGQQRGPLQFYIVRLGGRARLFTELFEPSLDIASLPTLPDLPHTVVLSRGLAPAYIAQLWDRVVLMDREDEVLRILKILVPTIERVFMVSDQAIGLERIAMMRVKGIGQPISLRSYGDGVARLFDMAVTAMSASEGILLIDEIENGIHYSALPELWENLFTLADQLDIQVFATTHSRDCVEAFQLAASSHAQSGQLIRLGHKSGDVVATLFDEDDLAIIARDHIEVR